MSKNIRNIVLFDGENFYRFTTDDKTFTETVIYVINNLLTMDFEKTDVTSYTVMDGKNMFTLSFDKDKLLDTKKQLECIPIERNFLESKSVNYEMDNLTLYDAETEEKIRIVDSLLDNIKPEKFVDQVIRLAFDEETGEHKIPVSKVKDIEEKPPELIDEADFLIFMIGEKEFKVPTDRTNLERIYVRLLLANYNKNPSAVQMIDLEELQIGDKFVDSVKHQKYIYNDKTFKQKCKSIRDVMSIADTVVNTDDGESIMKEKNA